MPAGDFKLEKKTEETNKVEALDVEKLKQEAAALRKELTELKNKIAEEEKTIIAASDPGFVNYSCLPVERFTVGRYEFTNGYLRLPEQEAVKFDQLLDKIDVQSRLLVKKLDKPESIKIVTTPMASKVNDSTSGPFNPANLVGKEELKSATPE